MYPENKERIFRQAVAALVACMVIVIMILTFTLLEKGREMSAEDPSPQNKETISYRGPYITVYEYESCEYIVYGQSITHKGNCKYCAARK